MSARGMSVRQSAVSVAVKEAAAISLSSKQRSFTRRVEAYLNRSNKRTPEAERDKDIKRIANSLEHIASHMSHYYGFPSPDPYKNDSGEPEEEAMLSTDDDEDEGDDVDGDGGVAVAAGA
ncbi:MAG: hypothetical protein M1839_005941 [Geoglossum umbratile]|nr:MAG: hypothetical protein M1839_005941 [Geoglossum umbratile]